MFKGQIMPGWASVELDNSGFFKAIGKSIIANSNQQIVIGNNNVVLNNVKTDMSGKLQPYGYPPDWTHKKYENIIKEEDIGETVKPNFKKATPMTIGDIKKRILLDLAINPKTIGLVTAGLSLIICYWAFETSIIWPFLGFLSILAGVGIVITSLLLNLDTLTQQAVETINEEKQLEKEKELDQLDECLVAARGPQPERDQTFLRELRSLYNDFSQDLKDKKLSEFVSGETVSRIKDLFDACVHSLSDSYDLLVLTNKSRGDAKSKFLNEREVILNEVGKSVERFTETIAGIRALNLKSKNTDLSQLRNQLNDSLDIARRTEQRMAEIQHQIRDFE